jgi:hypothetical protein
MADNKDIQNLFRSPQHEIIFTILYVHTVNLAIQWEETNITKNMAHISTYGSTCRRTMVCRGRDI